MLVLSRKIGDRIFVSLDFIDEVVRLTEALLKEGQTIDDILFNLREEMGSSIKIRCEGISKGTARLSFDAHSLIKIHREEIWPRVQKELANKRDQIGTL